MLKFDPEGRQATEHEEIIILNLAASLAKPGLRLLCSRAEYCEMLLASSSATIYHQAAELKPDSELYYVMILANLNNTLTFGAFLAVVHTDSFTLQGVIFLHCNCSAFPLLES